MEKQIAEREKTIIFDWFCFLRQNAKKIPLGRFLKNIINNAAHFPVLFHIFN